MRTSDPAGAPSGARQALALATVLSLTVLVTPRLPAVDFPQHLALATILGRLWQGDPDAAATFQANAATHNAGIHFVVAALGRVMPIDLAGRLFLAAYPLVLVAAAVSILRTLRLPVWRAALLVPATLGFSFGWGFANFCVGTALGWACVALVLRQLTAPSVGRAAALATLSIALGVTHVMAMLLAAVVALACGMEFALRHARSRDGVGRVALAGAPMLAGCVYDLHVYLRHVAIDGAAYTTQPGAIETSLGKKALLFGASVSPLFGTYLDTALAWMLVALLAAAGIASRRTSGRHDARPLSLPMWLMLAGYFAIPHVFLNTHLVFQRLAQWTLVAAVLAIPPLSAPREATFRRLGVALAMASAILLPAHFAWFSWETRGLSTILAAVPPGARVVGDIESTRTLSIRMPALTHVAALAVPRGAADDGFSFARWMGMPVNYRKEAFVPFPDVSFEHGHAPYDAMTPFARRFPWLVVRTAWKSEPDDLLRKRLFGDRESDVKLVARDGEWALFDSRALSAPASGPPRTR